MKLVTQNIIPYSKQESSTKILESLNKIADKATPLASDSFNEKVTNDIQGEIFAIINTLSQELGLGGSITEKMQTNLNQLEKKIVPYLNQKNYFDKITDALSDKTKGYIHSFLLENKTLWWKVGKDTGVWLRIGDWEGNPFIAFWSDYGNRQYENYRYRSKGRNKDFFNFYRKVETFSDEEFLELLEGKPISMEKINLFIEEILAFYNNENSEQNIVEIINKCN